MMGLIIQRIMKVDVYASASGTVIRKENDSLLGWIVTIEHQKGIQTILSIFR